MKFFTIIIIEFNIRSRSEILYKCFSCCGKRPKIIWFNFNSNLNPLLSGRFFRDFVDFSNWNSFSSCSQCAYIRCFQSIVVGCYIERVGVRKSRFSPNTKPANRIVFIGLGRFKVNSEDIPNIMIVQSHCIIPNGPYPLRVFTFKINIYIFSDTMLYMFIVCIRNVFTNYCKDFI